MENFIVYRFVRYELSSMGFVAPELNTTTVCPACPQVYKTVHLSDYVFPHTVRSMYASTSHLCGLFCRKKEPKYFRLMHCLDFVGRNMQE